MIKIKDKGGITLIGLIITIVVILILTAITIYTGTETIDYSRKTKFLGYMQVLQKQVDYLVQNGGYEELGTSVNSLSSDKKDEIRTWSKNAGINITGWNDLPLEYQEVEYLENTGSQYIKTGVLINDGKTEQETVIMTPQLGTRQLSGTNARLVFWSKI